MNEEEEKIFDLEDLIQNGLPTDKFEKLGLQYLSDFATDCKIYGKDNMRYLVEEQKGYCKLITPP